MVYRKDIDGLRAIAVLSVIIGHANASWLPGGFTGVDVFFVISGFLITSIIYSEINTRKFSYSAFYLRRIKRILPVFFLMLFVVLVTGSVVFLTRDVVFLAKAAQYAALFSSNILFTNNLDYFASATIEQPLIHTWSLAVEEQFYFVWPLLLILLTRCVPTLIIPAVLLMMLASYGLATVLAGKTASAMWGFYQLPARMGELLTGSLLVFLADIKQGSTASGLLEKLKSTAFMPWLGILLIALSFFAINENSIFPGVLSLLPCMGAALLIFSVASVSPQHPVRRCLESSAMVFIGGISYSLYLWHWPILAFSRYITMRENLQVSVLVFAIVLTFVLSVLSWKYVEQPVRKSRLTFAQAGRRFFLYPAIVVLLFHAWVRHTDGNPLLVARAELENIISENTGCMSGIKPDCNIGAARSSQQAIAVLLGDSHAKHYALVFAGLAKEKQQPLDFYSSNACPLLIDENPGLANNCLAMSQHIHSQMHAYNSVLMVYRWSYYFDNDPAFDNKLRNAITQLSNAGKKVYLVAQAPEYAHDVLRSYKFRQENNSQVPAYQQANAHLQHIANSRHVFFVDFSDVLHSWPQGQVNDLPGYMDNHHLNQYGQLELLKSIKISNAYAWIFDEQKK